MISLDIKIDPLVGNLEKIYTGTLISYDLDKLELSIYIVDILRIDDLRIDDQSSMLKPSIYTVTLPRVRAERQMF